MRFPSRKYRTAILLFILLFVAADTWLTHLRTTDWDRPLWLLIYPVNGDNSTATANFIRQLDASDFIAVESFLAEEAKRYGLPLDEPVAIKLAPEVKELPPAVPVGGSRLDIMWWSLKLRLWSKINDSYDGPGDLKLFVLFHDPERQQRLGHSTGLQKGRVGIVRVFADRKMQPQNNVVIAHELMHLFGASDKYDLSTNQPHFPGGFAEPNREPRYPQRWAELMAGRIPLSELKAVIPDSLRQVIIGETTATEINWLPH